ncbi:hypothetical protein CR155_20500 [Pollutimonas nitritireducens]|uniref:Uncharacterized protein n=1 Tax=Pollutimonas nitritireducens TaxID=2045209 RepID=A0A2N4UAG2_9BURK|nr:hypothetical protein [Pollutimonas nitritireducens]PLC51989.1 hypothetical protein CR155_20500 [Pollutimonas nitritireducens]
MAYLDCETVESTISCIAEIYGVQPGQINAFFDRFDIEQHFESRRPERDGAYETKRLLEDLFGQPKNPITRTYWFHLTRVPEGTSFQGGILPLNEALPRIWEMLYKLLSKTKHVSRLREMALNGVADFQYTFKTADSLHWGPYAMLVKDIGVCAESVGNHDYLRIPEIVEDICNGYEKLYSENIQSLVEASLVPTVVKFWSEDPEDQYGLESAIYYAYLVHHKMELTSSANTCFVTARPAPCCVKSESASAAR